MDGGSEPGLAVGDRPGVGDAVTAVSSVAAAASDATGSAISTADKE